jgi:hypothetical protein
MGHPCLRLSPFFSQEKLYHAFIGHRAGGEELDWPEESIQISDEMNLGHGAEFHFYMAGIGIFYSTGIVRGTLELQYCSPQIQSVISTLSE